MLLIDNIDVAISKGSFVSRVFKCVRNATKVGFCWILGVNWLMIFLISSFNNTTLHQNIFFVSIILSLLCKTHVIISGMGQIAGMPVALHAIWKGMWWRSEEYLRSPPHREGRRAKPRHRREILTVGRVFYQTTT